jgi:hypothetical protein
MRLGTADSRWFCPHRRPATMRLGPKRTYVLSNASAECIKPARAVGRASARQRTPHQTGAWTQDRREELQAAGRSPSARICCAPASCLKHDPGRLRRGKLPRLERAVVGQFGAHQRYLFLGSRSSRQPGELIEHLHAGVSRKAARPSSPPSGLTCHSARLSAPPGSGDERGRRGAERQPPRAAQPGGISGWLLGRVVSTGPLRYPHHRLPPFDV